MATTIKHKNGTSDPSSSDFNSVAELLINTDDGGLFTKTDGGSVVEIGSGGGATGGGSDTVFYENGQTVTTNYTITNNTNAMSAGPITVNSGVTVTIGSGENWIIL
tara:strand:- start:577 stop:894 length:318 start_codon:yes stop_codon:yes gene_type:complete